MRLNKHFIIIGTAKSGSSTLYEYLKDHPSTHLANIKEHNFFMDIGYNWKSSRFKIIKRRFIFTIGSLIPFYKKKILERYKKICNKQNGCYSGDGSINYFYRKEVPKRIKTFVPDTKLILLLRNPIDRVYSNFWMNTKQKISNWKYHSFEEYIENNGHKEEINLYSTSLKRWLKYFTLKDILIIESSTFFKKNKETLYKIEEFLDLDHHNYKKNIVIAPFQGKSNNYDKMDSKTRRRLTEFYLPYVNELKKLTKIEFDWKDFN